ncbi:MAG: type I restriction enzyme HsdR N-terminal domain-containing protein, partial [Bacteroidaceae bacterium]|nr:type I restriction enzyme HsdR N-terminal domain-containing protein [Bacteroidaceae bacterium]
MLELNLPSADIRLERRDGRLFIWDFVRRRWVVLTPEEWVRQHFSHWMTEHLGYPLARLGHEISLEQNGMQRRADAVFYDRE